MPLTKRQFELGVDEEGEALMRRVYDLLVGHPELAYSSVELEEMVVGKESEKSWDLERAVEVLVELGALLVDFLLEDGANFFRSYLHRIFPLPSATACHES